MLVTLPVQCSPLPIFRFSEFALSPLLMPYPLFHHNFKSHRFSKDTYSHKSQITYSSIYNRAPEVKSFLGSLLVLYQRVPVPVSCYGGILNLPIFVWNYPIILLIIPENIYIKPVVFLGVVFVESSKLFTREFRSRQARTKSRSICCVGL